MSMPLPRDARAPITLPMVGRTLLVNMTAWSAVAVMHAISAWSDAVQRGRSPSLGGMLYGYALAYAPLVLLGTVLYLLQARSMRPWRTAALVTVLFFPLEITYQAVLIVSESTAPLSGIVPAIRELPALILLLDLGVLLATNAVVYAVVAAQTRRREDALERALQEGSLRLRLALEQQRLQGLRAQLEPHFLHNALNAISGLIRNDDHALALTALQQLSRLLRYATTAVTKDRVPLAEEVAFLQEYLALQQLRFGSRLSVEYEGVAQIPDDLESPPLLLQPLAENAIRHGLERSDAPATVSLRVSEEPGCSILRVSNTVPRDAPPNPGLGVGLAALQARVDAAYRGRATFTTVASNDRFEVTLVLPHDADDD
ncbi:MAG: histidine kinase [Gemmatimonadaceae bacterium]|nr:histidine kinase [Gemmatimonadaceae bacterium]